MDFDKVNEEVREIIAREQPPARVRQALLAVQEAVELERRGDKYDAMAQMGVFLADALAEMERLQDLLKERDIQILDLALEIAKLKDSVGE